MADQTKGPQQGLNLGKGSQKAPQEAAVGKAAGGRVAYFLHTDDFVETHARMTAAGVTFREPPRHEPYGTVAVFDDLYGNGWDLIEPKPASIQINP